MFVGHYGPSFAIKAMRPSIPLWLLFIAVQLVDVAWAVLVILGIEKVRIVPGITASNPLDLYYMPFTHSLVAAVLWAVATVVLCKPCPGVRKWPTAAWVGGAVFSHWILDFVVHRPDLSLYDDTMKVGLGLWNSVSGTLVVETGMFVTALVLYQRGTRPTDAIGKWGYRSFVLALVAIYLANLVGPPPPSVPALAWVALGLGLFLLWAAWFDRHRRPVGAAAMERR